MLVDLVKLLLKLVIFVGSVLDELASVNQFSLISRLFHDGFVHLLVGFIDFLDWLFAPFINILEKFLFDLESLIAQLVLHLSSHDSEEGIIDNIIGEVEDFIVGLVVVQDLFTKLLDGDFLLTPKELFDEGLLVNVQDVLILFVFLEEL